MLSKSGFKIYEDTSGDDSSDSEPEKQIQSILDRKYSNKPRKTNKTRKKRSYLMNSQDRKFRNYVMNVANESAAAKEMNEWKEKLDNTGDYIFKYDLPSDLGDFSFARFPPQRLEMKRGGKRKRYRKRKTKKRRNKKRRKSRRKSKGRKRRRKSRRKKTRRKKSKRRGSGNNLGIPQVGMIYQLTDEGLEEEYPPLPDGYTITRIAGNYIYFNNGTFEDEDLYVPKNLLHTYFRRI